MSYDTGMKLGFMVGAVRSDSILFLEFWTMESQHPYPGMVDYTLDENMGLCLHSENADLAGFFRQVLGGIELDDISCQYNPSLDVLNCIGGNDVKDFVHIMSKHACRAPFLGGRYVRSSLWGTQFDVTVESVDRLLTMTQPVEFAAHYSIDSSGDFVFDSEIPFAIGYDLVKDVLRIGANGRDGILVAFEG